jgi:hypothetical protein
MPYTASDFLEGDMNNSKELKKAYNISVILYIALMLSLAIYLVVFTVFKTQIPDFQGMMEKIDFPWLRYAFYALGLLQIFLIKFIRETATKSLKKADAPSLIRHLQRMSMISAALCEVPAILGWALFFLSGMAQDFYILLGMSFFLFVVYFPRLSNWEEWTRTKTSH